MVLRALRRENVARSVAVETIGNRYWIVGEIEAAGEAPGNPASQVIEFLVAVGGIEPPTRGL